MATKGAIAVNGNKDKSIILSQGCLIRFALLLLALDIGCYWEVRWFIGLRRMPRESGAAMMVTLYLCSVFAWLLLWHLWRLLLNLKRAEVFVPENVRHLRAVSWCCAGAAAVCLLSCLYYLPFLFVTGAAGFMALIVRIVKNVFQQAIAMKSELDLTI